MEKNLLLSNEGKKFFYIRISCEQSNFVHMKKVDLPTDFWEVLICNSWRGKIISLERADELTEGKNPRAYASSEIRFSEPMLVIDKPDPDDEDDWDD